MKRLLAVYLLVCASAFGAATTVTDNVNPIGTLVGDTITGISVAYNSFTATDGTAVTAGSTNPGLSGGAFTISLSPNATTSGVYTVTYTGTLHNYTELWVVPISSSILTLTQVRNAGALITRVNDSVTFALPVYAPSPGVNATRLLGRRLGGVAPTDQQALIWSASNSLWQPGTATVPLPTASTIGGVESLAATSHQWINAISTLGVPSSTQPSFTDIAGSLATSQLPTSAVQTILVANAGTTGTTLNTLTKLTGAPSTAVIAGTSDTVGIIGITSSGAGTTSSANIAYVGSANCVFDGATTAGDYVIVSTTVGGDCHDNGASYPVTANIDVIGKVLTTNGAGGTYVIDLFSPETRTPSLTTVFGRSGAVVAAANDYSFSQISGTLGSAQLPTPTAGTLGGIDSLAAVSSKWINTISLAGVPSATQPAFTDISGSVASGQLPTPTSGALGGVKSLAATSHQWINTIATTGIPASTQPATSDLSDVSSIFMTNANGTAGAFTYDYSGAAHTLPVKKGTVAGKPGTCTQGEVYFATDATAGQNLYLCGATNAWTQQLNSGSGGGGGAALNSNIASPPHESGSLTLSGGGTGTYTYSQTYMNIPKCTATDTTGINATRVSAGTKTQVTVSGTASDVINVVCDDVPTKSYYVDPVLGSDNWSGTIAAPTPSSTDGPWRTVTKAKTAMQSGSIKATRLRGGTYTLGANLAFTFSDNGTTWMNYPGETPVIDGVGSYTLTLVGGAPTAFYGLTFTNLSSGGVFYNTSVGVTWRWNTWLNCNTNCLSGGGPQGNTFDSNIINGGANSSDTVLKWWFGASNNKVTHNLIQNCQKGGVQFASGTGDPDINNNSIDRNIILNTNLSDFDNGALYMTDIPHGGTGNSITNNLIYNVGNGATGNSLRAIYLDDEMSNATVSGNICQICGTTAWQLHGGNNNTITNNIWDLSNGIQAGFYQVSGLGDIGMTGNAISKNIYYSNTTFNSTLYNVQKNAGDALPTNANNLYYSANSSSIPNTTIVDTNPTTANPQFGSVTNKQWIMPSGSPAFSSPVSMAVIPVDQGPLPYAAY